jgi:DNA-binding IclR family transcriptional regulator
MNIILLNNTLNLGANDRLMLAYCVRRWAEGHANFRCGEAFKDIGVSRKTAYNCLVRLKAKGIVTNVGSEYRLDSEYIAENYNDLLNDMFAAKELLAKKAETQEKTKGNE